MLKTDGVIWHISMSVDGYVADVSGSLDFMTQYRGPNPLAEQLVASIGAILSGRPAEDKEQEPQAKHYGGATTVPEFIVTRRPIPENSTVPFLDGNNLSSVIKIAKSAAAGGVVAIIGPKLATAFLKAGLVDQIVIHIVPVLLGSGVALFEPHDGQMARLMTVSVTQAGAVINLILEPAAH